MAAARPAVAVTLNGLEEVLLRLESVKTDVKKKGGRYALRKAAEVVRAQVADNARALDRPETPNKIYEKVVARWNPRRNKATGDLAFRVGINKLARKYVNNKENRRLDRVGQKYEVEDNVFYWRFLEFGTEHSAAKPFMRPALAQSAQRATDEFIAQYKRALDRALRMKK